MSDSLKQAIVIDSDAGVDDALAIILALRHANLLGVTCVHGNTTLDNVVCNVQKILKKCKREDVPVFRGASTNLIGVKDTMASNYHGEDGMGDVPDADPPDPKAVQSESALQALIRLSKEHPGGIILNAIGPLTNIAMAMRMDPDFTKRLKEIVIMGGNISGKGVVYPSVGAEFNFFSDPEAAHAVLSQAECPITVVPFETCYSNGLPWDWFENWTSRETDIAKFIHAISKHTVKLERYKYKQKKYFTCDSISTAVALRRNMILTSRKGKIQVERNGTLTRGQMVEMSHLWEPVEVPGPEVEVVLSCDMNIFQKLMEGMT